MSHTTTLKPDIRDLNAVRAAVAELVKAGAKISLLTNTEPRMYYSNQHGKCDLVMRLDDKRYDVGLQKQKDGTYAMVYDAWAGEVSSVLGDNRAKGPVSQVAKFVQTYTKHAAINAAVAKGYTVSGCTVHPTTGKVNLTINVH
jgi:hypothetical protein